MDKNPLTAQQMMLIAHLRDSLKAGVAHPRGDGGGTIFEPGPGYSAEKVAAQVASAQKVLDGDLVELVGTDALESVR